MYVSLGVPNTQVSNPYSVSVFVDTNFPKAEDFYGRNLQAH